MIPRPDPIATWINSGHTIRLFAVLMAIVLTTSACLPRVSTRIEVVDDTGKPVEGALVKFFFPDAAGTLGAQQEKRTNASGIATARGVSLGRFEITVSKEGYYDSPGLEIGTAISDEWGNVRQRYTERTVVLKRMLNPIPLRAQTIWTSIPATDIEVGFDFEVGDWIQPFGNGVRADMSVKVTGFTEGIFAYDRTYTLRFPHAQDGICAVPDELVSTDSILPMPRHAPRDGYQQEFSTRMWRTKQEHFNGFPNHLHYFLRVRSRLDKDGNIESNYVKLRAPFKFTVGASTEVPGLLMTYYFNPIPNDRNLEFDTEQNLYQGLDYEHQVHKP